MRIVREDSNRGGELNANKKIKLLVGLKPNYLPNILSISSFLKLI
jgi:hypothetical protein